MIFVLGTSVLQVTATDSDDPTYGNSAKIVYSILQGQPYFSVDPKTGVLLRRDSDQYHVWLQAVKQKPQVGVVILNIAVASLQDGPACREHSVLLLQQLKFCVWLWSTQTTATLSSMCCVPNASPWGLKETLVEMSSTRRCFCASERGRARTV